MLVDLRRMCTGPLVSTFPRYVESVHVEERSALVSTALPGAPMSVGYHQWLHTARRSRVAADFRRADAWLTAVPDRHPPRRQADDLAGRDG